MHVETDDLQLPTGQPCHHRAATQSISLSRRFLREISCITLQCVPEETPPAPSPPPLHHLPSTKEHSGRCSIPSDSPIPARRRLSISSERVAHGRKYGQNWCRARSVWTQPHIVWPGLTFLETNTVQTSASGGVSSTRAVPGSVPGPGYRKYPGNPGTRLYPPIPGYVPVPAYPGTRVGGYPGSRVQENPVPGPGTRVSLYPGTIPSMF